MVFNFEKQNNNRFYFPDLCADCIEKEKKIKNIICFLNNSITFAVNIVDTANNDD